MLAAMPAFSDSAGPVIGILATTSQRCGHQPGQPLAFRADDEHQRRVGELEVADVRRPVAIEADHEQAVLLVGDQGPGQVRGLGDGNPGQRASRRLPCARR